MFIFSWRTSNMTGSFRPSGLLLTRRKAGTQWSWPSQFRASRLHSQMSCSTLLGFGTLQSLWSPWNLLSSLELGIRQDKRPFQTKINDPILKGSWVYATAGWVLYVATVLSSNLPVSDVFCWESSSSSDSDPRSRSLPPFSMLLLELPAEVWETPNLEVSDNGEKLRWDERFVRQKCFLYLTLQRGNQNTTKLWWGLPCSGFSLCCIVHLLLLPNVLFFFSIIKLANPLFTAGFKSSCIGLCAGGRS